MNTVTIHTESYPATDEQVEQIRTMLKPKVRDGYREPIAKQRIWFVGLDGKKVSTTWNANVQGQVDMLALGLIYLIESNCDLKCEQLRLTAELNRWVDEHDGRVKQGQQMVYSVYYSNVLHVWIVSAYSHFYHDTFRLNSQALCEQFITENKSKLDRLKAIEQTLDVTLYQ